MTIQVATTGDHTRPAPADSSIDRTAPITVTAVIPCLNEARSLGICIQKAFAGFAALDIQGEVVVADNGSTDDSVAIAKSLNARIVFEKRKGYGAALSCGINAARGEIIVMGDADDSYDWSAIGPFISKVQEGYDLVMGNRFAGGVMRGAMPPLHRYLGNPALSWIGRVAFHTRIGDFHCGMRAFTKSAFKRMAIVSDGMEFATEMVASASCIGLRIGEVSTKLYPDKRGRPPHLRSFRDGWRHLRFILTYAPDYLYLIPGSAMFVLGMILQILLVHGPVRIGGTLFGIHFLALGSLLTLVGFNIVTMGVLAKAVMAHRYRGLVSWMNQWIRRRFSLELGLMIGVALVLFGASVQSTLAIEWLRTSGGPMKGSIHLAFVAATLLVLGFNLMLGSFLLNMILTVNSQSRWVGPVDDA
jgi:glycosyltransferase involved in cell wall biosynthesis